MRSFDPDQEVVLVVDDLTVEDLRDDRAVDDDL